MRIHDRYYVVANADHKITRAVLDAVDSLEDSEQITNVEFASILCNLPVSLALKYALREERHGTTEKKADEA